MTEAGAKEQPPEHSNNEQPEENPTAENPNNQEEAETSPHDEQRDTAQQQNILLKKQSSMLSAKSTSHTPHHPKYRKDSHQENHRIHRNKAHHHKSAKIATMECDRMLKAPPLHLPNFARDPFKDLRVVVVEPVVRSPYIHQNSVDTLQNYYSPSPPRTMTPLSLHSPSLGGSSPRAENGENGSEEPSTVPNELTLTYLSVLQKSEDFDRRTIRRSEFNFIRHLHDQWSQFTEVVQFFLAAFGRVTENERKYRDEIEAENPRVRGKLEKQKEWSYRVAKQHEDRRPTCPIIVKGQSVHLDPIVTNSALAEIRWRGDVEVAMYALTFDEDDSFFGAASLTGSVKVAHGTYAIKHFGDGLCSGATQAGGAKDGLHIILANLPPRVNRVAFVIFNGQSIGRGSLENLRRTWFTLKTPPEGTILKPTTEVIKERYSCQVEDGGPFSAIYVASITKKLVHQTEAWMFQCHNESFIWVISPQHVAQYLTTSFKDGKAAIDMEMEGAYERLAYKYIFSFWDDLFRQLYLCQYREIYDEHCQKFADLQKMYQMMLRQRERGLQRLEKRKRVSF